MLTVFIFWDVFLTLCHSFDFWQGLEATCLLIVSLNVHYQFYIMKVVKSRAFKDRLKGHKESVITLFSPFGEAGHMLYSISKDGSVRGFIIMMQVGIWRRGKSR